MGGYFVDEKYNKLYNIFVGVYIMKKKIISLLTMFCLVLPCFFAVACKKKNEEPKVEKDPEEKPEDEEAPIEEPTEKEPEEDIIDWDSWTADEDENDEIPPSQRKK